MNHAKTRQLTLTAIFLAVTILLGMTPIGLIPLGFINVTILCVPVIIGTILLGLKRGLMLGFCFGLVSTLSAFGLSLASQSSLAAALLAVNPLYVIVMSMVPRLLVPVVTYFVYRLFARKNILKAGIVPAAIAGSLTNTVFYLGLMLLFYYIAGLNSATILGLIGGTGAIAGSCEAAVAAIISTPVLLALFRLNKTDSAGGHKDAARSSDANK